MSHGNRAAKRRTQKFRGTFAQDHSVLDLAELGTIAGDPRCIAYARVFRGDAEAGDDGVISAGDHAEEYRIGMRHHRPRRHLARGRGRDIAEKEIGDVALKHDEFGAAGENAGKHPNRALKNGDYGEHGRYAECNASDADDAANAVPAEIGEDEAEVDHVSMLPVNSQGFSITRLSSVWRSERSLLRNASAGLRSRSRASMRSPR